MRWSNPAVTIARTLSDTFAGIDPASVPAFVLMQMTGGAVGYALFRILYPALTAAVVENAIVDPA